MTAPFDLLRKNELRVDDAVLDGADLTALAHAVAQVLDLNTEEVLVTDYLDNVLTFDVLRPTLYSHQLLGRSAALLSALRAQPGITLGERSKVSANGMLGWIATDDPGVKTAIEAAQQQIGDIDARICKRIGVFSTGAELVNGDVKDTNWTSIHEHFTTSGFTCTQLGTLPDDRELIAGSIRQAIQAGYGVVLTSGGVGAEAKDCTVEAVLTLAPRAATAYVCRFEQGHGRHVKEGIRVAVATVGATRILTLPGPNDEVRSCLDAIAGGLGQARTDEQLAHDLAEILRQRLHARMGHSAVPEPR